MKPNRAPIVISLSVCVAISALISTSCSRGVQDQKVAADRTPTKTPPTTGSPAATSTPVQPNQPGVTSKATTGAPADDPEVAAWKSAMSSASPTAYMSFHKAYPNSTHLTVFRADVDMSTDLEGNMHVTVSGHPDLAGDYGVYEAMSLGLGAKANADGNIVLNTEPLKDVELFVARIGGKSRIVAVKRRS